jgi:hypothetical protein
MGHDIWSLVLVTGLWGWIVATLIFIFRAFPRRGVFEPVPARRWGATLLFFFFLWILGLLNA